MTITTESEVLIASVPISIDFYRNSFAIDQNARVDFTLTGSGTRLEMAASPRSSSVAYYNRSEIIVTFCSPGQSLADAPGTSNCQRLGPDRKWSQDSPTPSKWFWSGLSRFVSDHTNRLTNGVFVFHFVSCLHQTRTPIPKKKKKHI